MSQVNNSNLHKLLCQTSSIFSLAFSRFQEILVADVSSIADQGDMSLELSDC